MDGWVVFGTRLDTKDFDKQISEVEYELEQIEYELSKKKELKLDDRTISEYESKAEKLRNKIIDLKKRQEDLNNTNLSDVTKSVDNVGNSVSKVIKKVTKWALAVFSVRSAYSLISRSVSTLSQYNDQIKTDIEYISFSIATALQPVVEYLIKLVYELLGAINDISIAWFGVNLFAKASAENMNKVVKSAQKMRKALAGFDEMNVMQDTSSSGGAGITSPSVDFTKNNREETEKVKNFWKDIAKFWEEDVLDIMASLDGNWATMVAGFYTWGQGIYTFFKGVKDVIVGLFQIIVGAFSDDMSLMEEGWKKLWNGLLNILTGVLSMVVGGLLMSFGVVKGLFLDLYNSIKGIVISIYNLFYNMGVKVGEAVGGAFKYVINAILTAIENRLNKPINSINSLINKINGVTGINLGKLSTIKLPRLAKGTIVNAPGRGVLTPDGRAIYGEAGPEAYLPLSDTQLLEQLGSTIGRYITINANITNTMNGRVISRELQKINTNSDFARNS